MCPVWRGCIRTGPSRSERESTGWLLEETHPPPPSGRMYTKTEFCFFGKPSVASFRAFSHRKARTKVCIFFTLYTFDPVSFGSTLQLCDTLKDCTWHTYILSSSPMLAPSPHTCNWLVCRRACVWRQHVVYSAGGLLSQFEWVEENEWRDSCRCLYNSNYN